MGRAGLVARTNSGLQNHRCDSCRRYASASCSYPVECINIAAQLMFDRATPGSNPGVPLRCRGEINNSRGGRTSHRGRQPGAIRCWGLLWGFPPHISTTVWSRQFGVTASHAGIGRTDRNHDLPVTIPGSIPGGTTGDAFPHRERCSPYMVGGLHTRASSAGLGESTVSHLHSPPPSVCDRWARWRGNAGTGATGEASTHSSHHCWFPQRTSPEVHPRCLSHRQPRPDSVVRIHPRPLRAVHRR